MARRGSALTWGRPVIAAVIVAAAVVVALAGSPSGGRSHADRPAPRESPLAGPTGVAAAYGFPARCLSITISTAHPAYARADFNHGACGSFAGYVTAIFHRVAHEWRPVLVSLGYRCPVGSLPAAVQAALDVCS
jgi:hypothetical protein